MRREVSFLNGNQSWGKRDVTLANSLIQPVRSSQVRVNIYTFVRVSVGSPILNEYCLPPFESTRDAESLVVRFCLGR